MEPSPSPGSLTERPQARVQAPDPATPIDAPATRPLAVTGAWLGLILVAAVLWWVMHIGQESAKADMDQALAKRDQSFEQRLAPATVDHQSVALLRDRVNALELELDDARNKVTSLDARYQELMQSREDRLLADLEQSVMTASQQLQLAGNVEGAIIVLQASDGRLANNSSARFVALRRLIARDIERLKSSALADSSVTTVKLESIVAAVDRFPLAFEQRVTAPLAAANKNKTMPQPEKVPQVSGFFDGMKQLFAEIWQEVRQLVRVERLDLAEPALLMPPQIYFLRENLKLRLLAARVALLQRDGRTYQEELRQAQNSLTRFFDMRSASVQAANETMKQLLGKSANIELPNLDGTLNAIRATKIPRSNP